MSDEQKQQLEQQLWNIANTLRGKMDADQFRDYILGFIFYKYLSEKIHLYANSILKNMYFFLIINNITTAKYMRLVQLNTLSNNERFTLFLLGIVTLLSP